MSRFLIINTNNGSIAGMLSMSSADALLNVKVGQTLLAINPLTDTGATFLHESVTLDLAGASPVFINAETNQAVTDPSINALTVDFI